MYERIKNVVKGIFRKRRDSGVDPSVGAFSNKAAGELPHIPGDEQRNVLTQLEEFV